MFVQAVCVILYVKQVVGLYRLHLGHLKGKEKAPVVCTCTGFHLLWIGRKQSKISINETKKKLNRGHLNQNHYCVTSYQSRNQDLKVLLHARTQRPNPMQSWFNRTSNEGRSSTTRLQLLTWLPMASQYLCELPCWAASRLQLPVELPVGQ